MPITVRLIKPAKNKIVSYEGEMIERDERHLLLVAIWNWKKQDLGYVVFEPGDRFYEHFYTDRWYNIFEIHSAAGVLKCWYCNVTRPALFTEDYVESEDLELDLFVSPDRQQILVLDEDEFATRDFATSDPEAYTAARTALQELQHLAERGDPPFHQEAMNGYTSDYEPSN